MECAPGILPKSHRKAFLTDWYTSFIKNLVITCPNWYTTNLGVALAEGLELSMTTQEARGRFQLSTGFGLQGWCCTSTCFNGFHGAASLGYGIHSSCGFEPITMPRLTLSSARTLRTPKVVGMPTRLTNTNCLSDCIHETTAISTLLTPST
ncbi:hypothetical protein P691DRAFT_238385 [Macrolepiota fuliginosa MF-IS2]|uniref:Uncharacterized protein n=1 Tax=Macrolepiota fuliginosa MF-IS2 TaxID=1400762 RepID=A0A9P6BZY4_9AGAR|nr:hypothetical protein P691DRAFT_238385 [Macrolepiota fuliginosa MF-IS2]